MIANMQIKKYVFLISFLAVTLLIGADYLGTDTLCGGSQYTRCMRELHSFFTIFIPVFPLFFFSLITYFLRDEVFETWAKFAIPGVLASMVLIYITTDTVGGGFGPQIMFGKGDTALLTSALFVILSAGIVVWKYFATRPKRA